MDRLVTIRSSRYGLDIELDQEADFDALLEILADKFRSSARFFKDAKMALSFSGRHLTRTEGEDPADHKRKHADRYSVCSRTER